MSDGERVRFRQLSNTGRLAIRSEFLFGFGVGVWSIVLNFQLSFCGMTDSQIGTLLSVGYLVTAFVSFFAGRLGERFGYPLVMVCGNLMMGLAYAVLAFSRTICPFYLGHMLYSAGMACSMSMEYNLPLSQLQENQKQYAYNMVLVQYFMGSIAGNLSCGLGIRLLRSCRNPYRYLLLFAGVIYIVLAAIRMRIPRRNYDLSGRKESRVYASLLAQKRVRGYLLYGFLSMGLLIMVTGMLNLLLRSRFRMPDTDIGMIFTINSLIGCAMLMLLPLLIRKFSLFKISSFVMALQLCVLAAMAIPSRTFFVPMIFLRTMLCNILYTSADAPMLRSVEESARGTYSGIRVFSNYLGMSAASLLSGIVLQTQKYLLLFAICSGIALAQNLVYHLSCAGSLKKIRT